MDLKGEKCRSTVTPTAWVTRSDLFIDCGGKGCIGATRYKMKVNIRLAHQQHGPTYTPRAAARSDTIQTADITAPNEVA